MGGQEPNWPNQADLDILEILARQWSSNVLSSKPPRLMAELSFYFIGFDIFGASRHAGGCELSLGP